MKKLKYLALGCLLALGTTSCEDWLDVNVDQDSPSNASAKVENRLPWIEHFYLYSAGVTNVRTAHTAGLYYSNNGNLNALSVTWNCPTGATTTPYQTWFVEAAANLNDLTSMAEAEGATHYKALSNIFHALGFMEMLDLYGEIPYTQALGSSPVPAYDDGKTIFYGCIAKLDEAIELLSAPQADNATALSAGDFINEGNTEKWIKACYGLKARYLLKLSKKSEFDAQAILDCLAKAPQSIADNTLAPCYNSASDVTDYLLGDPVMTNGNWNYAAYGNNQRMSKYHVDLLLNMRGAGVEDPRYTKIVPAAMSNIKLDPSGKVIDYTWLRSEGVDCLGEAKRLVAGGATSIAHPSYAFKDTEIEYDIEDDAARAEFVAAASALHKTTVEGNTVTVLYQQGSTYINDGNYVLAGDTIYVNLRTNSTQTGNASMGETDVYNYFLNHQGQSAGAVGGTGSFQLRPNSDQELVTYHEMCFIKAEVLYRKGDKDGALAAYKAGIQAHMDMMQDKLEEWQGTGFDNPDMMPMDEEAISEYMASAAVVQNSSELTMSDIMLQKMLAMGCSIENWNDMRRFNYSVGNVGDFGVVYPGYKRGPLFAGQAKLTGTSETDPTYWIRRWRLPGTLELTYNETEALAINAHALDTDVWKLPVWWDCATDDEYYGYLK